MSTFAQDLSVLRQKADGMAFEDLFSAFADLCREHGEELSPLNATYRVKATDTGRCFTLRLEGGKVSVPGEQAPADVTLLATESNGVALIAGRLSPALALLTRKLKVQGSMAVLTAFAPYLEGKK